MTSSRSRYQGTQKRENACPSLHLRDEDNDFLLLMVQILNFLLWLIRMCILISSAPASPLPLLFSVCSSSCFSCGNFNIASLTCHTLVPSPVHHYGQVNSDFSFTSSRSPDFLNWNRPHSCIFSEGPILLLSTFHSCK